MRMVANKHRLTAYHNKLSTNIEDFKRRRKLKINVQNISLYTC